MDKQKLIELHAHYKLRADIQHELGNFGEAAAYDDLAKAVDMQILELMVREQEDSVRAAVIA